MNLSTEVYENRSGWYRLDSQRLYFFSSFPIKDDLREHFDTRGKERLMMNNHIIIGIPTVQNKQKISKLAK